MDGPRPARIVVHKRHDRNKTRNAFVTLGSRSLPTFRSTTSGRFRDKNDCDFNAFRCGAACHTSVTRFRKHPPIKRHKQFAKQTHGRQDRRSLSIAMFGGMGTVKMLPRRLHPSVEREPVKILLVEDETSVARAMKRRIESSAAVSVVVAETRADAIRHLEADVFAGIIMDIELPDAEDLETLERSLEIDETTPTIVLSGHSKYRSRVERLNIAFHEKPIDQDKLEKLLDGALRDWTARKELVLRVVRSMSTRCRLTQTEATVLFHLIRGRDPALIAVLLGQTISTTRAHLNQVRAKLGAHVLHRVVARALHAAAAEMFHRA